MSQKVIRIRDVLLIQMPHKESSIHGTLQKVHKIENYFEFRNKADLTLYAKFPLSLDKNGYTLWSAEVFASAKTNARLRLSAHASAETDALQNYYNLFNSALVHC